MLIILPNLEYKMALKKLEIEHFKIHHENICKSLFDSKATSTNCMAYCFLLMH